MNNETTATLIKCPYCAKEVKGMSALSAHLRTMHAEKWKGNTGASLPANWKGPEFKGAYIPKTTRGIKNTRKGVPKKPIKNKCPYCSYTNYHPPGMARHIQANHPDQWKGNLGESMGREPSRKWKGMDKSVIDRNRQLQLEARRKYQQKLRDRYYREGRNSKGEMMPPDWKPRKWKNQQAFNAVQPVVQSQPEKPKGPALGHILFCPNCGHNIRAYELAKGLIDIEQNEQQR